MATVEKEVCVGLAYLQARQRQRLPHAAAMSWAREHWMDFLDELDTDTGKLLVYMESIRRNQK